MTPTLPETHPNPAPYPLVECVEQLQLRGQAKVAYPAADITPQNAQAVVRKRTERSELVCPVGGGRLGPAEHPVEHFTLRVANDR
jgi:hypothetical protein